MIMTPAALLILGFIIAVAGISAFYLLHKGVDKATKVAKSLRKSA